MQQIMSSTSKVLVDQKGGGGNLLYLPLDKLMQLSAASPGADITVSSKPATASETPAPAATTDLSRAQQLRGRDSR